jgi:RNA polymerase sigma-70 factor (ECF subfamily)
MTGPDASRVIEEVLSRFARLVRGIGGRHGLVDADLDEVVQDVRIRLWHAHEAGEAIEQLPTSYVYRTAMSAALDLLRSRRRREGRSVSLTADDEQLLVADSSPEEEVLRRELAGRVASAVDTLAPPRRAVVRAYLQGYERREIVALLGWSDGKVRNLLSRGLADVRAWLSAHEARSPLGEGERR